MFPRARTLWGQGNKPEVNRKLLQRSARKGWWTAVLQPFLSVLCRLNQQETARDLYENLVKATSVADFGCGLGLYASP